MTPATDRTQTNAAVQLRLNVAREIVTSIPTLTVSGQQFAIQKVVTLFDDNVRGHVATVLRHRRGNASGCIEQLMREVARSVPDIETFRRTAEFLMDALTTA